MAAPPLCASSVLARSSLRLSRRCAPGSYNALCPAFQPVFHCTTAPHWQHRPNALAARKRPQPEAALLLAPAMACCFPVVVPPVAVPQVGPQLMHLFVAPSSRRVWPAPLVLLTPLPLADSVCSVQALLFPPCFLLHTRPLSAQLFPTERPCCAAPHMLWATYAFHRPLARLAFANTTQRPACLHYLGNARREYL